MKWFYQNKGGALVFASMFAIALILAAIAVMTIVAQAKVATATFTCPVGQVVNPDSQSTYRCLSSKTETDSVPVPLGFSPVAAPEGPADVTPPSIPNSLILVDQTIDLQHDQLVGILWEFRGSNASIKLALSEAAYQSLLEQSALPSSLDSDHLQLTQITADSMVDLTRAKAQLAVYNGGVMPTNVIFSVIVIEQTPNELLDMFGWALAL